MSSSFKNLIFINFISEWNVKQSKGTSSCTQVLDKSYSSTAIPFCNMTFCTLRNLYTLDTVYIRIVNCKRHSHLCLTGGEINFLTFFHLYHANDISRCSMMHAPLRTIHHKPMNKQQCVSTMSVVVIVVCFTQPFTLSLLVMVCSHYLFALKATFALEVHVVFTIWYFMNPF